MTVPLIREQVSPEVTAARTACDALSAALAARPDLDLSDVAREWILGQAWGETGLANGPGWAGSNNYGAVVYHLGDERYIVHGDRTSDGRPVEVRFQAYATPEEGVADLLRVVTRTSSETDALDRGGAHDYAVALFRAGYYTGVTGDADDRIAAYTSMILQGAAHVRTILANADLQDHLNARGALPILLVDGVVGPLTRSAIARFQLDHGLPVTGEADTVTLASLRSPTVAPPDPDPEEPCP